MRAKQYVRVLGALAIATLGTATCLAAPEAAPAAVRSDAPACRNAPPVYPEDAQRKGEEGVVKAAVLIAADGTFLEGKVRRSSGSRSLDKATIAAAATWCWTPKIENGAPVEAWQEFSYRWSLG